MVNEEDNIVFKDDVHYKKIVTFEPIEETNDTSIDSSPMNLKGNFDIITKAKSNRRIIAGYASVIEIDKENHIIPKEALEKGIESLLEDSEYSNLMIVHQNIQIGKIIPKYNKLTTHVDDKGLFIIAELRTDLDTANQIWELIKGGKLNGFSIAGEIVLDHEECSDISCVKVIDKLNIFEVSVCDTPVNAKSGFIIVSKGKDEILRNVSNIVNKNEEHMTETKCEECDETIENKAVDLGGNPPTLSETIEELSRQVTTLTGIIEQMQKQDEEEEEEEFPEEKAKKAKETPTEEKAEDKPKVEKKETPTEQEVKKSEEHPYPSKKDFDDLKKSVDELLSAITKAKEFDEMKTVIKGKDEEISTLTESIKLLKKADDELKEEKPPEEKPKEETPKEEPKEETKEEPKEETKEKEVEPQTTVKTEDIPKEEENTSELNLVKDNIERGVFYRNPDY